jgi:hypothetical protein
MNGLCRSGTGWPDQQTGCQGGHVQETGNNSLAQMAERREDIGWKDEAVDGKSQRGVHAGQKTTSVMLKRRNGGSVRDRCARPSSFPVDEYAFPVLMFSLLTDNPRPLLRGPSVVLLHDRPCLTAPITQHTRQWQPYTTVN